MTRQETADEWKCLQKFMIFSLMISEITKIELLFSVVTRKANRSSVDSWKFRKWLTLSCAAIDSYIHEHTQTHKNSTTIGEKMKHRRNIFVSHSTLAFDVRAIKWRWTKSWLFWFWRQVNLSDQWIVASRRRKWSACLDQFNTINLRSLSTRTHQRRT